AAIFDVFGTVVDWRSGIADAFTPLLKAKGIDADPIALADAWRAEYQPSMERIRNGGRGYVGLDDLHLENLDRILAAHGLEAEFSDLDRQELNSAWEALPPWSDVLPGLKALAKTHLLAPCSNGSIAMMARLARNIGLPWHAVLGAEIARDYKPKAEVYLASANALRLAPEQVLMVAAHNSDLAAAASQGLATAFVPRLNEYGPNTGETDPTGPWTLTATDFEDLARQLA
ncbi:MAG: haloacid dehalogenase type II, partial [Pseudomonadota bacterium]